ncbi:glyoxylase-like metal-dependent hydrolase (beta-lactamase superfamily II) [Spinactinospora alkalitolerans]|uniref:Glyoxylase-like metal-dependent hydrolase (Beta-lactamase superfamily II) n=1 Tax=Spinactinospora alkalitolerans TaxID=687207 RepID=A0A852TV89_9ACTN|nr:MBL fold metallo-hydrolase [Spinactinospora alkalitolerans]NYE45820.1 glyoxylase-like metal-dependent hydrolase (beta-lactamase superfamily II) [Spinactinospora alkalitolerans]
MREMPPVEDLGSGMWSVPVPIPGNPLGYTLVYVLESPRGPVLVDAGWQHEDSWEALTAGLESLGTSVDDVYGAVITHFHPDHSGLAGRVREASGAWIAMHHADVAVLRYINGLGGTDRRKTELDQLRRAGAGAEELRAYEKLDPRMDPPALPDRELSDGELVDLPQRKLRVVWTPGHSPGHICLHLEDSNHLFTGDHVLPGITPHIGLYSVDGSDGDPLGAFLNSLAQVPEIGAAEALPAHEQRFTDIAGRTAELIEHHEDRLRELLAVLSPEPLSLWELTAALTWSQGWEGMRTVSRRMAASEAAAHLRVLERRGLADLRVRGDDVLRWSAGSGPR